MRSAVFLLCRPLWQGTLSARHPNRILPMQAKQSFCAPKGILSHPKRSPIAKPKEPFCVPEGPLSVFPQVFMAAQPNSRSVAAKHLQYHNQALTASQSSPCNITIRFSRRRNKVFATLQLCCTEESLPLPQEHCMKAFSLFLGIYILLLGTLPCLCADEHAAQSEGKGHAVECGSHSGGMEDGADSCSPFCLSHCCIHSPLAFQCPVRSHVKPLLAPVKAAACNRPSRCLKGFGHGVWRPPVAKR